MKREENQYLCGIFKVSLNKTNVPEDVGFPGSSLENAASIRPVLPSHQTSAL